MLDDDDGDKDDDGLAVLMTSSEDRSGLSKYKSKIGSDVDFSDRIVLFAAETKRKMMMLMIECSSCSSPHTVPFLPPF